MREIWAADIFLKSVFFRNNTIKDALFIRLLAKVVSSYLRAIRKTNEMYKIGVCAYFMRIFASATVA